MAADHDGYALFRIGFAALAKFRNHKTFLRVSFFSAQEPAATSRVFSSIAF
jgi:hypothetical protein